MSDFKRVILKDPVTGDFLAPKVPGTLMYEEINGTEEAPFSTAINADTLGGYPAAAFVLAENANFALSNHNHDSQYALKEHVHDNALNKSLIYTKTFSETNFTDFAANALFTESDLNSIIASGIIKYCAMLIIKVSNLSGSCTTINNSYKTALGIGFDTNVSDMIIYGEEEKATSGSTFSISDLNIAVPFVRKKCNGSEPYTFTHVYADSATGSNNIEFQFSELINLRAIAYRATSNTASLRGIIDVYAITV